MEQSKRTHSIPLQSRINVTSYTIKNKGENVKKWGFHSNAVRTILVHQRIFLNCFFFFLVCQHINNLKNFFHNIEPFVEREDSIFKWMLKALHGTINAK